MMKGVVRCTLLLLTAGLAVLPPGWCCAAAKAVVAATVPQKPAAPCCGCCCTTPAPVSEEAPAPPPARSWCCHRDPALTAKAVDLDTTDAAVLLVALLPTAAPLAGCPEPPRAGVLPPIPRLNVLHCTWIC